MQGIKSAPVGSLVWRLAILIGNLHAYNGGATAVAHMWTEFVLELRFRVEKSIPICGYVMNFSIRFAYWLTFYLILPWLGCSLQIARLCLQIQVNLVTSNKLNDLFQFSLVQKKYKTLISFPSLPSRKVIVLVKVLKVRIHIIFSNKT